MRLTSEGVRDDAFQLALGAGGDDAVLAIQAGGDGRIWVAGRFRSWGGVVRRGVARLLESGAVDPAFDPGSGPDDAVLALALRDGGSGGVWVGGGFREVNGVTRAGVAAFLPGAPAAPRFDGWAAEAEALAWRAVVAPGQSYRVERSADLEAWREAEVVKGGEGRVSGQVPYGEERTGWLRLGRILE